MSTEITNKDQMKQALEKRGIDGQTWRTLKSSIYPGALNESVLSAIDYCRARNLDVLKKPVHIVPMQVEEKFRTPDGRVESKKAWRDVILPGIYELRTTAQRTGQYLGHSKPIYGEETEHAGVVAPAWCEMTIIRWNPLAKMQTEYPVRVQFNEVVATKGDGTANQRWRKAPVQMLTKCTEAAGLREAFPDELGGVMSAEEMDGRRVDETVIEGEFSKANPTRSDTIKQQLRKEPEEMAADEEPPFDDGQDPWSEEGAEEEGAGA